MADPKPGALDEAAAKRFQEHIEKVWNPLPNCPFHPTVPTNWLLNSNVGQIPGFAKDVPLNLTGSTFPALIVTCSVCGFMVPINGLTTGILELESASVATPSETSTEGN